jgi:beta-mannosidase
MVVALDWEVGWRDSADGEPSRWVPAAVPGAVQLDWARAEGWDDHTYGENWRQYEWMEDRYWTYRARLRAPALTSGERLYFVSKGIDYSFTIRLDGAELQRQEGMFTPVELDITESIREGSLLEIMIEPAPKRADAPKSRSQADHSCKPAVSYGWDWHPRLIPLGIWDETYLIVRPAVHIVSSEVRYELNESLDRAKLQLAVRFNDAPAGEILWSLTGPEGEPIFELPLTVSDKSHTFEAIIDSPQLWWPHDHGGQPLYTSEVRFMPQGGNRSFSDAEGRRQRIGFRRVKLVVHEGGWKEPSRFPKSRSLPPITMEINGRVIFCKGTNWVNPSIFPGTITAKEYGELLKLAKEANMNMLRIWGGGIVNKESFFEQCNEMGLMVWQEFPLACNLYPDTPAYLKVLDQESRSIIIRLRKHPSVVLWCGGNELFNAWSKMTDQSLPLRLLNANCYELDAKTPFLMTSPIEGMGHGHYMFQYRTGEDVLEAMPRAQNTAYTEFGVPSPSSVEQLKSFIPPEELFPPKPGTAWESHHAFHALSPEMWLMEDQLEHYFGPYESLEQLVGNGQLLQSEGYKCIYEEARRQKPKCSMALNWCYNEPWPTAANNSIVMWPAKPKPAYYAVQASCRPVLASARIPKFVWNAGDWFEPELWLLNDSPNVVQAGRIKAFVTIGSEERQLLLAWEFASVGPNENRRGPTARYKLPGMAGERIKLELVVDGKPEWDSEYTVLYRNGAAPAAPKRNTLNFQ